MPDYAPPTRIRFISHPITTALREGRVPRDEPLDAHALKEVRSVHWRPNGSYRIAASPEARTRETAAGLGLGLRLSLDATTVPELRECDFGRWRGRSLEDIYVEDPEGFQSWLNDLTATPHDGESFQELLARVGEWLDCQQEAGPCIVITHSSIIRAAIVHALSAPEKAFWRIEVPPLSVTDLRFTVSKWHVRSLGVPLVQGIAE